MNIFSGQIKMYNFYTMQFANGNFGIQKMVIPKAVAEGGSCIGENFCIGSENQKRGPQWEGKILGALP